MDEGDFSKIPGGIGGDLSKIPAGAPPPGQYPNFINPPTLLHAVIATTVVVHSITLLFILARAYVNIWTRRMQPEDVFIYTAWCAFIAFTGLLIYNCSSGMARHIWDVNLPTLFKGSYWYSNVFICYAISGGFAKAAVFWQFKRIFTTKVRVKVYWVVIGSLVANAFAYLTLMFLYVFNCWPMSKLKNPMLPGHCMDWKITIIVIGAVNLVSDIEAFFVPAWAIWQLQLAVKKKIEVFAVFAVRAFAVAVACMGLYYRILIFKGYDTTWHLTQTSILCMAELGSVIIVGCCPSIPRILRRHQINSTPASRSDSYGSSPKSPRSPKSKLRFNTADRSNGTSMLQTGSEERLEMYGYAHSIERAGSDDTTAVRCEGIVKTTHVTQTSARMEDVEKHDGCPNHNHVL